MLRVLDSFKLVQESLHQSGEELIVEDHGGIRRC